MISHFYKFDEILNFFSVFQSSHHLRELQQGGLNPHLTDQFYHEDSLS